LEKINSDIEKAYAGMDKNPYHLQAICVHDGNAMSGHYFAFIKDRFNNKWRKFNDYRVTDVTEEEVFQQSNGGHSWMTAYWVVYVNQEVANEIEKIDLHQYQPMEKREQGKISHHDVYSDIIPGPVRMLVSDENAKLFKEIQEYQAQ
jgi:ubiquitin carboxyl-terminal hydrolase 25